MEKKMRLYDKFWDMITPLTKEDVALHNAEMQSLKEYERLMRADAERIELENAEARARVALIEEENDRQRKLTMTFSLVARVEFDFQMTVGKEDKVNVTGVVGLSETCEGGPRKMHLTMLRKTTGSLIAEKEYGVDSIMGFIQARASYQLFVQPWLDGRIATVDLMGASQSGDCCQKVLLVPTRSA